MEISEKYSVETLDSRNVVIYEKITVMNKIDELFDYIDLMIE